MRYMMLIKHSEDYRNQALPPALMEAMGGFIGEGMQSGAVIDTAGLAPTADGSRIRLRGGKITVTDGPFTEAKEIIGGYAIIEAASRAAAMEYATKFMDLHREHWPAFDGECEVRALETGG